jgi:hypothetical protein
MKNINLKFTILLILLPLILIIFNPLLNMILIDLYPHTIINISTNYMIDPNSSLHSEENVNSSGIESKDLASTLTQQVQNIFKATEEANVTQDASEEAAEQVAVAANNHPRFSDLLNIMGWGPNQVITIDEAGNIVESFTENSNEAEVVPNKSSDTSNNSSDVNMTSDSKLNKDPSSHESIFPLLLTYKHSLINIKKLKTNWNKLITTPIILGKSNRSKKSSNLKFIVLLLPFMFITIDPLLIYLLEDSYLRFIIKHTTFYLDNSYLALDTFVNQLEAEAAEIWEDYIDEDDPKLASDLLIQWQNTINTLNSVVGANNENIIIEENGHNILHELDTNNSETENSDVDTSSDSESNASGNSNSVTDVNSSVSEPISPFPVPLVHKIILTKLNKVKTNWNKLITTPIVFDNVKISIPNNNFKLIRVVLLLLPLLLMIINPLLLTVFEDRYLRFITKLSINYFLSPRSEIPETTRISNEAHALTSAYLYEDDPDTKEWIKKTEYIT